MSVRHHDLVLVGSGSANSIPGPEFDDLDIAIVEGGVFGGTCLNVGCIPTKMYVYPADVAALARHGGRLDVDTSFAGVDWPALRDRVFGRIDPISEGGKAYREGPECPNITVYTGYGHFVGPQRFDTGTGVVVEAERFVLAAGSRPVVPAIPGLVLGSRVHTSDTIMRLAEFPAAVLILGGGFIAAEFNHVFSALGAEVTQVVRSGRLLAGHDDDVAATLLAASRARSTVLLDTSPRQFVVDDSGVTMHHDGGAVRADVVLVATGRVPNADRLGAAAAGVELTDGGYIAVDRYQRTSAPGIFALGDVCQPLQLKHVANHEARVVRHNLLHPEAMIESDHRVVPSAVFTDPQIASVGLTAAEAVDHGLAVKVGHYPYAGTAAGWARRDEDGFVKVLVDSESGLIVGAHVVGPEAATVIQPLIQAMQFGQRAEDVARQQYWIHPALTEVVENALLAAVAG